VSYFLERKSRELKIGRIPSITPAAIRQLQDYHWPGNVRELENLIERSLIRCQAKGTLDIVAFDDVLVWDETRESGPSTPPDTTLKPLDDMVAAHIKKALEETGGRVEGPMGAAKLLGLHPSTLRARMRKLKIPFGRKA
jgi:transcriptional regulator with GAF, ATPase, and Fis domain